MSTPPPVITVVIPVWNGEQTIERTLASALAQTFTNLEVLVINDGSTDSTAERVGRFNDPRVRLHNFTNAGLAASRNRGIRLARGEFIAFLDADDLWLPRKLERQLEALRARPAAALAYGFSDCVDADDRYIGHGSHIEHSGTVYEKLLLANFLDNGSTPLVRASALATSGIFDESLPAAEDWDLWLRLAWHFEVVCVPEPLTLYRVHGQSMSANLPRQEAACLRVLENAIARLPAGPHRDELRAECLMMINKYLAGRALSTATAPDRRAALRALRYVGGYLRWAKLGLGAEGREHLAWSATQSIRAGIVLVLPRQLAHRLLTGLAALRSRSRR